MLSFSYAYFMLITYFPIKTKISNTYKKVYFPFNFPFIFRIKFPFIFPFNFRIKFPTYTSTSKNNKKNF